jgi:hypothetical protein
LQIGTIYISDEPNTAFDIVPITSSSADESDRARRRIRAAGLKSTEMHMADSHNYDATGNRHALFKRAADDVATSHMANLDLNKLIDYKLRAGSYTK